MTIALGADHAGFEVKQAILRSLQSQNIDCIDYGTYTEDSVDYPDFAHPVAICWNEDLARLARRHNNANIIAIPARYIDLSVAVNLVNIFLYEEFDGGRHATRVDKIPTA